MVMELNGADTTQGGSVNDLLAMTGGANSLTLAGTLDVLDAPILVASARSRRRAALGHWRPTRVDCLEALHWAAHRPRLAVDSVRDRHVGRRSGSVDGSHRAGSERLFGDCAGRRSPSGGTSVACGRVSRLPTRTKLEEPLLQAGCWFPKAFGRGLSRTRSGGQWTP